MCVLIFFTTFAWNVEVSGMWYKMYIGLRVNYPLFLSGFGAT